MRCAPAPRRLARASRGPAPGRPPRALGDRVADEPRRPGPRVGAHPAGAGAVRLRHRRQGDAEGCHGSRTPTRLGSPRGLRARRTPPPGATPQQERPLGQGQEGGAQASCPGVGRPAVPAHRRSRRGGGDHGDTGMVRERILRPRRRRSVRARGAPPRLRYRGRDAGHRAAGAGVASRRGRRVGDRDGDAARARPRRRHALRVPHQRWALRSDPLHAHAPAAARDRTARGRQAPADGPLAAARSGLRPRIRSARARRHRRRRAGRRPGRGRRGAMGAARTLRCRPEGRAGGGARARLRPLLRTRRRRHRRLRRPGRRECPRPARPGGRAQRPRQPARTLPRAGGAAYRAPTAAPPGSGRLPGVPRSVAGRRRALQVAARRTLAHRGARSRQLAGAHRQVGGRVAAGLRRTQARRRAHARSAAPVRPAGRPPGRFLDSRPEISLRTATFRRQLDDFASLAAPGATAVDPASARRPGARRSAGGSGGHGVGSGASGARVARPRSPSNPSCRAPCRPNCVPTSRTAFAGCRA